jgi:hypothetical protein
MKEAPVEKRLVDGLTKHGFKVLKLQTPGTQFTPDRLILRPLRSPGAPWVIEVKRPGKTERRGQELVRDDWRARGVFVLDMVNTYDEVDRLIDALVDKCRVDQLAYKWVFMDGTSDDPTGLKGLL